MTKLGVEEGCPPVKPANFDSSPSTSKATPKVVPPTRPPPPTKPPPPSRKTTTITAAPELETEPEKTSAPQQETPSTAISLPPCDDDAEKKKQFVECANDLLTVQTHILSVIWRPKEVDNVCKIYRTYSDCIQPLKCILNAIKGPNAVFDYACGAGNGMFKKVDDLHSICAVDG